jgi:hypothetical protein
MDNQETQTPLSLDCPFLIAPFVSSAQFCLCLWIFHSVLPLLCVLPNVAYVSGLSILDGPFCEGTIKNRQSRDICNIGHQTKKGQSRMDNPETQATFGTRHRRGTQEWIIQCLVPNFACVSGLSILDFPFYV